jgi:hypothetical protein
MMSPVCAESLHQKTEDEHDQHAEWQRQKRVDNDNRE